MSSFAWRLKRLRAMRPQEVLFRIRQAARMREELRREPSPVAQKAHALLELLPIPSTNRTISFFDFKFPYPEFAPDWHADLKSGIVVRKNRWPEIDYRRSDEVGSAKNVWELNRHQFLERWADEDSADAALAVIRIILDWIASNQRPFGINWCSSLEPAFRLISWQRALERLGTHHVIDSAMPVIMLSVDEQCDHIRRFPSLYSSANNHLIGELTGLLAGATILGGTSWIKSVYEHFQRQIQIQVTADGVDREQAVFYHDYVLGFLQRAKQYAIKLELPRHSSFDVVIEKMADFSDWMQFDSRRYFEIGDRDDGISLVERLQPFIKKAGTRCWEQGGYAISHTDDKSICFRAGNFGYPSIAAHAHCDQLSVQLVVDGIEVLTDAGTYCYHEDEQMRQYFKGTSAHNSLRIDHKEQAEYGGPFLWSTHADAELSRIGKDVFEGRHFGYCRIERGLIHARRVDMAGPNLLEVQDRVKAVKNHDFELFWNLGPECSVSHLDEGQVEIKTKTRKLRMAFQSANSMRIKIGKGLYSRRFGVRQETDRIEVSASGREFEISTIVEDLA
jgi:hypothetical protein